MNLLLIFLTGLTTGGLSCLAVQGGLLASVIAGQKENELKEGLDKKKLAPGSFDALDWMPVVMFLVAKLFVHIIFGFLLGALGSVISLSLPVLIAFQIFAALFMFATAMNLLNVHPIFRYVLIQPPSFLRKYIKNSTRNQALFAPFLLGSLTVFMPCGITQAMEILAVSSGNPIYGALIMGAFVLGTFPLFSIIGIATAKLSEVWRQWFLNIAAYALILMSLYSFNGVLQVINSPVTFQKIFSALKTSNNTPVKTTADIEGTQKVKIDVTNSGYSPDKIQVKSGIPVELTISTNNVYSCASSFVFRSFGISVQLQPTDSKTFTFTPTKKGKYTFSCSMGMYIGEMEVI